MEHDKLDAYGHLTWTVGNEDWIACFDARRVPDGIEYHVVVNCESGGFVDTLEHATVPATEEGIRSLLGLPGYWASICMEHYPEGDEDYPEGDEDYGPVEWEDTAKAWESHVRALASEPAPEASDEDDGEGWWTEADLRSWRP